MKSAPDIRSAHVTREYLGLLSISADNATCLLIPCHGSWVEHLSGLCIDDAVECQMI